MALSVVFSDLPDDMIIEILSRLPNEELFRIESVSKSVQHSVRRVLNRVEAIAFQHSIRPPSLTVTCDHISLGDDLKTISVIWDEIPITSVVEVLKRCPQVKCLDLRLVDNIDILTLFVSACPQLECLYLDQIKAKITSHKWMYFVDLVGRRLRHLSLNANLPTDRLDTLIKACHRLERCHLECLPNSVDKLMSLKCLKPDQTVLSLEIHKRVLKVSHRIEGLTAPISTFKMITKRDDNKLDQLRQLTVFDYSFENDDEEDDNIHSIQFSALETLKLFPLKSNHLLQLAECGFPKLRTLHLHTERVDDDAFQTLFEQTTNVKRLILDISSHNNLEMPGQSLTALTQLEMVDAFLEIYRTGHLPSVIAMVGTLAEMETIKKVRMRFEFPGFILISKKQMKKFARAVGRLKKRADKVKIQLVYGNWPKKKAQQQLDDWNEAFRQQPEVKRVQQRRETEDDRFEEDVSEDDSDLKEVEKLVVWL